MRLAVFFVLFFFSLKIIRCLSWFADYVSHGIWQINATEMQQEVQFLTTLLLSTMPNTTILPISGNHEWFPTDQVFLVVLYCCCVSECLQFIIPQAGTETLTEDLLNTYADIWSFLVR